MCRQCSPTLVATNGLLTFPHPITAVSIRAQNILALLPLLAATLVALSLPLLSPPLSITPVCPTAALGFGIIPRHDECDTMVNKQQETSP